jgi:hypothetical protein
MRSSFELYECEHDGDFRNYEEDIEKSGGVVINHVINDDAEIVYVMVEHGPDFWDRFKETETYGFLN